MRDFLIAEAASYALFWMCEFVIVKFSRHKPLFGQRGSHA